MELVCVVNGDRSDEDRSGMEAVISSALLGLPVTDAEAEFGMLGRVRGAYSK